MNTFQQYVFKNSNIVHAILTKPGLESKFDEMCDELIGKRLLPMQKTFVKEYVEVMARCTDSMWF